MILTAELADAIVERAMNIIHHNVNVISNDGIIVASGDKSRIGQLHEIGLEAAREKRTISIYDEDMTPQTRRIAHYAPGINTPILVNGQVIFVVGVSGNPHEISRYAALAVLTAELLAKQAVKNREINWSMRFDDMLLLNCLNNLDALDASTMKYLSAVYDFSEPHVPYLVRVAAAVSAGDDLLNSGRCLQEILRNLALSLDVGQVNLLEPNLMFLLAHRNSKELPFLHEMNEICRRNGMELRVARGFAADSLISLIKSLRFARYCLNNQQCSLDCVKSSTVLHTVMNSPQYSDLLEHIREQLNGNKLKDELQQTINIYLQQNLELLRTADALKIHRNTLKNRFKIIRDLTGLDPDRVEDLMLLHLAFHQSSAALLNGTAVLHAEGAADHGSQLISRDSGSGSYKS